MEPYVLYGDNPVGRLRATDSDFEVGKYYLVRAEAYSSVDATAEPEAFEEAQFQIKQKLKGDDSDVGFGSRVALCGRKDNILAVGDDSHVGSVFVFRSDDGGAGPGAAWRAP